MKLAKRVTLHDQGGNSPKIYEVDLCQISEDKYIVNFRSGRPGKNLKEGSETVKAVSLAEAERIFEKLIAGKKKKGYEYVDDLATAKVKESNRIFTSQNPRHQDIIKSLAQENGQNWPLDTAIWRAGELKIKEAVPLLINLIGTGKPLRDYCIAWALGKCGDKNAISELIKLVTKKTQPEHIQRIVWEALYSLSDEREREKMKAQKIKELPLGLRDLAENGSVKSFEAGLTTYLNTKDYKRFKVIDTLYQIDNQYIRPTLLKIVKEAPLQPNYFKQLRHIFKMAEYRGDAEIFGILAYRFDKEEGNYSNINYLVRLPNGNYIDSSQEEIKNPQSKLAYSKQTREYLRKRVWRTLKTLGAEKESDYVKLATGILLNYKDSDGKKVKESSGIRKKYKSENLGYQTYSYNIQWDKYASLIIFNHILYENNPRYQSHPQSWRCKGEYKPGDSTPNVREEAFPELWNQQPSALLRLLRESKCLAVQEFAVRAIRENQEYCNSLDVLTLIQLLSTSSEITAKFAFNYASKKYDPQSPNSKLVLAMADCIVRDARQQAYQWIEARREYFLSSSVLIAGLITSLQSDTRAFARQLLSESTLNESTAQVLIIRIISALLDFDDTQVEIVKEISETLLWNFTPQLSRLRFKVILELLNDPLPERQVLGAEILLNHETPATELTSDLIESLLSSPYESVASVGIRIFEQLPDERVMRNRLLIITMAVNSSADIRKTIRPVIERLAQNHPEFGYEIAIDFIDMLTEPERHEGVHKDLGEILRSQMIPNWITRVSLEKTMSLVGSKSSVAQELGGIILQANINSWWWEFSTSQLVKFANHEILAIRQAAWPMMELKLDSIRGDEDEMLSAVKMLDAKWEDSQEFAQSLFNKLNNEDWTPKIMIEVCDSTKGDVRRFGRDIVISNFKKEYGQEYLLKFSEHPSADMQTFATNYLETYAVDDPEKLQQLVPYFVTVLSGVNKGRIAKKRIFQFLEKEADKNKIAATIVAEVLTRQSVTMAIADKAQAIQIMLKIKNQYPDMKMPIQIQEVMEVRH